MTAEMQPKRQVEFKETEPEELWSIFVDGKLVEDNLRNDEFDIGDNGLWSLWDALNVSITFENHSDN